MCQGMAPSQNGHGCPIQQSLGSIIFLAPISHSHPAYLARWQALSRRSASAGVWRLCGRCSVETQVGAYRTLPGSYKSQNVVARNQLHMYRIPFAIDRIEFEIHGRHIQIYKILFGMFRIEFKKNKIKNRRIGLVSTVPWSHF